MTQDFIGLVEIGVIAGAAILYAAYKIAHIHDDVMRAADDIDRELESERAVWAAFDRFN